MAFTDWTMITTEERKAKVIPLLKQGLSASKIAAHFTNASRNAIIGFCHRNKLQLGNGTTAAPAQSIPRAQREKAKRTEKPRVVEDEDKILDDRISPLPEAAPAGPVILEDSPPAPAVRGPVSILDLNSSTCRMPLAATYKGMEPKDMMFCGLQVFDRSWCKHHSRMVYQAR